MSKDHPCPQQRWSTYAFKLPLEVEFVAYPPKDRLTPCFTLTICSSRHIEQSVLIVVYSRKSPYKWKDVGMGANLNAISSLSVAGPLEIALPRVSMPTAFFKILFGYIIRTQALKRRFQLHLMSALFTCLRWENGRSRLSYWRTVSPWIDARWIDSVGDRRAQLLLFVRTMGLYMFTIWSPSKRATHAEHRH